MTAATLGPFTTWISAGEITWLDFAVTDMVSLVTRQYTSYYSTPSCLVAFVATFVWSLLSPISHSVRIDRACVVTPVDFDVVCWSGEVAISSFHRFVGLVLLAFASCAHCFCLVQVLFPRLPAHKSASYLMHSAAYYEFSKDHWQYRGTYFLDPASAVLNGVVVIPWRQTLCLLDIKHCAPLWSRTRLRRTQAPRRTSGFAFHSKTAPKTTTKEEVWAPSPAMLLTNVRVISNGHTIGLWILYFSRSDVTTSTESHHSSLVRGMRVLPFQIDNNTISLSTGTPIRAHDGERRLRSGCQRCPNTILVANIRRSERAMAAKVGPAAPPPSLFQSRGSIMHLDTHNLRLASNAKYPRQPTSRLVAIGGLLYLAATLLCSIVYLRLLESFVANDFWWPEYNTTGAQTFLADLYNAKLVSDDTTMLDLLADSSVLAKDYSSKTTIDTRHSVARRILLANLTVEVAITTLRQNYLYENILTQPPSCWLDMGRSFEMAHTAARQRRCDTTMQWNAAVYLEPLLRNTRTTDLTSSTYFNSINACILAAVTTTTSGQAWVDDLLHTPWLVLPDETALWTSHGLVMWQNHLQNRFLMGIEETITVLNALGFANTITIASIASAPRSLGAWTTQYAAYGLDIDLDTCITTNASLVRSAFNAFETLGYNWDVYYNGQQQTHGSQLIRSTIGPMESIDIWHVAVPLALLEAVQLFQSFVWTQAQVRLADLGRVTLDPVPPSWVTTPNMAFYGGNPLCPFGDAMPYVQPSFSYYDDCGMQEPHTMTLTPMSALFAMLATMDRVASYDSIDVVCASCQLDTANCTVYLHSVAVVLKSLALPDNFAGALALALTQLLPMDIQFLQFASRNATDNVLLTQAMVEQPPALAWSFFGWVTMYDWVDGLRAVYTFAGDNTSVTLMSKSDGYFHLAADPLELPQAACQYIWYTSMYMTGVIVALAMLMVFYAVTDRFYMDGRNLFQVNRVLGGVWLGRPMLLARGLTAMVVLSTCSLVLVKDHSLTRFRVDTLPTWQVYVIAGETSWITYALNDGLLPLTRQYSRFYAPLSALLTWVLVLVVALTSPFDVQATLGRDCTILSFKRGLVCTSGSIQLGSQTHLAMMLEIVVVSTALAYVGTRMLVCLAPSLVRTTAYDKQEHMLIPAAADAFFVQENRQLDAAACVMCGILTYPSSIFNITLWSMFAKAEFLQGVSQHARLSPSSPERHLVVVSWCLKLSVRVTGLCGLVYMVLSVGGSYMFLTLTSSSLQNDFLWADFNAASGAQVYLSTWFNDHLQLFGQDPTLYYLDDPAYGVVTTANNSTDIAMSPLYATAIQNEVNSLDNVIRGLRAMNSGDLPWISTAYCFVDFNQTWEMANTVRRQARCVGQAHNGAAYLEAVLRNANWYDLASNWGHALEVGVFDSLRTSVAGEWWVASVQTNTKSVADEVAYWTAHAIWAFTTQWQNYKLIGVDETIDISSALGKSYPMTLKSSSYAMQLSSQTSFKLYWAFANDLIEVLASDTTSVLANASLVRGSPSFGFQNATLEGVLVATQWLSATPWDQALALFRTTVGPFGSVDATRVAPPPSLRALYQNLTQAVTHLLQSSPLIERAFVNTVYQLAPQPVAWDGAQLWGGNLLCEANVGPFTQQLVFFSHLGLCGNYLSELFSAPTLLVMKGIVAAGLLFAPLPPLWLRDTYDSTASKRMFDQHIPVLEKYIATSVYTTLRSSSATVKGDIRDTLELELVQYIARPNVSNSNALSPMLLSRVNIFDPTEPDMEFYAWLYLFDWIEGKREVVRFEGDVGAITTISTEEPASQIPVNAMEIPQSVSRYARVLLQYFTGVLLGVACLICVTIVANQGYIEGLNVVLFNRIAGLVWLGRPLMILRSVVAIALLSTSSLVLTTSPTGLVTQFTSATPGWFTTLLSVGEITWLVFAVTDMLSVVTQQYTSYYSTPSCLLACAGTLVWSLVSPISHSVRIDRACVVAAVDFHVICRSGDVAIGSFPRFLGLVALAFGSCGVSYVAVRLFFRHVPHRSSMSYLLHSAAYYEFTRDNWHYRGVYFLDLASAALNGILVFPWHNTLFLLDIKTWRTFAVDNTEVLNDVAMPKHLRRCIPLVD
ncbi:Aste57867_22402 [Aphanomyces stellatus]|uniref:Aste57867_22402 protein n=1 Tax=Aphanomyces stellatus TaxID=120398 RepID=A0A485LKW0_9STRA|nr:hypothetical protein As57867_022332 [Aphanomyces stellatus]VFT99065.1 Aste57867_22402 [Aphanomyces stellatus]